MHITTSEGRPNIDNKIILTENSLFKRLKIQIRQHGIPRSTWLIIRLIMRITLGLDWWSDIFLERPLAEPIKEIVPKIKVEIRQATVNDLDKFKSVVSEKDLNLFQQRFKRGRICFVALDGYKVAAYSWISLDEYDTSNGHDITMQKKIGMTNKEGYFFDILVIPEYRNNRLQTALDTARLKYVHSLAYNRVLTGITANNTFSLKSAASSGFKPRIFQFYNDAAIYEDYTTARRMYNSPFMKPESRADKCEDCGECLEKCPQHIAIPDWLKKAHEALQPEKTG